MKFDHLKKQRCFQQNFLECESKIIQNMEISLNDIPSCLIHNQNITHLCTSKACKISSPMICSHPRCAQNHGHPTNHLISIDIFNKLINEKTLEVKELIMRVKKYFEQLQNIICHQINKNSALLCQIIETQILHPCIKQIRLKKYRDLTPSKINQALQYISGSDLSQNNFKNQIKQISNNLSQIQAYAEDLIQSPVFRKASLHHQVDLSSLTDNFKFDNINSNILKCNDNQVLQKIVKKSGKVISQVRLLYRASENHFSCAQYHKAIKNKGPFLMVFQTIQSRKFGCILALKVNKSQGWISDATGLSCIFSLDLPEVFMIKQQSKHRVKALYIGLKGPQIGAGCDIYISDCCNKNQESGSNLGYSFQLPEKYSFGSTESRRILAGEENFILHDYEIFQIDW